MNYTQAQNEALRRRFNSMSPEMFQGYINNPRTGSDLKAWMKANNYQHPSMMQSSAVSPAVSPAVSAPVTAPVTSNLGMSSNHIGSYGPNKPSYLHLDQAKHSGTPISFNDPSIAGTPQSMTNFYSRSYPEGRLGMPGNRVVGDPVASGVSTQSNYYGADPELVNPSDQAVADSISKSDSGGFTDLQTAGMYYGANVATDALINTHDRKKVDTPLGNKGSQAGIVKGGIKGALLGAQLSGGNPYATVGGGAVGLYAGTQGGFDTETPPSYQVVGVRRRQGGGGLLAPKGMYG